VAKTRMTEELLGPLADNMLPEMVSPLVAYLASEQCPENGAVYSVAGGAISKFFIGRTPGYFNPQLTAEDIRDNWDTVNAEPGYTTPHSINDEIGILLKTFKGES
jgi:hypothetical protein